MALELAGETNQMPVQLAPAWPLNPVSGYPRQKSEYPWVCSTCEGISGCAVQPPAVLLCSLQPPSNLLVKVLSRKDGPRHILSRHHRSFLKALQYFLSNNTAPGWILASYSTICMLWMWGYLEINNAKGTLLGTAVSELQHIYCEHIEIKFKN